MGRLRWPLLKLCCKFDTHPLMTTPHAFADDNIPAQPEVLLVDDDEVHLLLTALALRERGFKIFDVMSGEKALALLAERTPDIIVLDAMMPGLDGLQVTQRIRRSMSAVSYTHLTLPTSDLV